MSEDKLDELLAIERANEARRSRRNRVIGWFAAGLVAVGLVVAGVWADGQDAREQERATRDIYCDLIGGC